MNTTVAALGFVLAGFGALWLWMSGVTAGRAIQRGIYRLVVIGRVGLAALVSSAVIVLVQWQMLGRPALTPGVLALVLGLPAVLAGVTVGRLLATVVVLGSFSRARGRRGRR